MIIARCPACQTVFRARPEQMSAHGGRVRCGQCFTPFNALDNLVTDAHDPASSHIDDHIGFSETTAHTDPQTPLSNVGHGPRQPDPDAFFVLQEPPPDTPAHPILSPWILEDKSPNSATASTSDSWPGSTTTDGEAHATDEKHPSTFERIADRLDFVVPDAFLPTLRKGSKENAPITAVHTSSMDEGTSDVSRMEGTSRLALPVAASTDASMTQEEIANGPPDESPKPSPFDTHKPLPEGTAHISPGGAVIRRRAPQPAKAVPSEPPSPEAKDAAQDEFPSIRRYGQTQTSPGRRWLMGLAIGILLGTLSAQVVYNFREEITRNWPQLRPVYLELCQKFGCDLPLPRVAAAIRITSSNLESDPTEPTRFVLNASIANQARHPLAFPHLELTLTDARDRSIVRRVLGPDEWARNADTSAGMAAGEEVEISLAFSAPDLTDATGYRVYAFYP